MMKRDNFHDVSLPSVQVSEVILNNELNELNEPLARRQAIRRMLLTTLDLFVAVAAFTIHSINSINSLFNKHPKVQSFCNIIRSIRFIAPQVHVL